MPVNAPSFRFWVRARSEVQRTLNSQIRVEVRGQRVASTLSALALIRGGGWCKRLNFQFEVLRMQRSLH